jgi:hypothetical protein
MDFDRKNETDFINPIVEKNTRDDSRCFLFIGLSFSALVFLPLKTTNISRVNWRSELTSFTQSYLDPSLLKSDQCNLISEHSSHETVSHSTGSKGRQVSNSHLTITCCSNQNNFFSKGLRERVLLLEEGFQSTMEVSPFSIVNLGYPEILVDEDAKTIERLPGTNGGKGIAYCQEPLTQDNRLVLRVDKINPDPIIHILNEEDLHCMKIGLTDCDASSLEEYPFHLMEACKPDYDCNGHSITVTIMEVKNEGDEVVFDRMAGGVYRVQVNGTTVFHLQDPHNSIMKTRSNLVYPFVMLSGSVEKVALIGRPRIQRVVNEPVYRELGTCVICLESEVDHMALPCNHAAFCGRDATAQMAKQEGRVCPICRNPVTNYLRIFLS